MTFDLNTLPEDPGALSEAEMLAFAQKLNDIEPSNHALDMIVQQPDAAGLTAAILILLYLAGIAIIQGRMLLPAMAQTKHALSSLLHRYAS